MTAPYSAYSAGSGWYVYNPDFNAPMTAAEIDLMNKLGTGDPALKQAYIEKYGPVTPSIGTDGWYGPWTRDQDYWNARYLNQLATPEDMQQLQHEQLTSTGYPYSIHIMNAIKEMSPAAQQAYFAGFDSQNLAGYLAAVVGISLSGKQNDLTVGVQPPTFTPTTLGQTPLTSPTLPPPTISGPIPPAPTTTGISGPTSVPPPTVIGVTPPTKSLTPADTQPPTVTAAPGGGGTTFSTTTKLPVPPSQVVGEASIFTTRNLLIAGGAVVALILIIYVARK